MASSSDAQASEPPIEAAVEDEVANLDVNVHVYDADQLENKFIQQAETAIEAAKAKEAAAGRKALPAVAAESAVQRVLRTDEAVQYGENTPFEMMIQAQLDLEREATARRQAKRIKELRKTRQPSQRVSTSRTKRYDSDDFVSRTETEEGELEDDEWLTDDEDDETGKLKKRFKNPAPSKSKKKQKKGAKGAIHDDGDEHEFIDRLREYHEQQKELRARGEPSDLDEDFHDCGNGYKISEHIWQRLYKYQKTGVRWLHQLNEQHVGGILADEMGLGKTIQMAVLLRSIAESRQFSRIFDYQGLGPTLIIAPTTLMHQWVRELRIWFPRCRVAVYHSSGTFTSSKKSLLNNMSMPRINGTILITSYTTYVNDAKDFLRVNWHYVICDEGHKIRNPDTQVATTLKELRTPHRLLLTGSPLQNNLKELWSLIDFVYPGRLGSLKEFTERFATPITLGGYATATKIQVRTAYKCACLLRDAINPYMLRRMKKDVEQIINLPEKSEQVLFCDITEHQRSLYKQYIASQDVHSIMVGKLDAFAGLITLRKLCNHPDLVTGGPNRDPSSASNSEIDAEFGAPSRSGKMIVLESLLRLWRKQGQKVLLFSQSKQMLTILEKLVIMKGYGYLRMDGGTPIAGRQPLVQRFETESDIFVFLLTTRVGGLGLNLTAANRVVIFDPDWNPSTDAQARERAWRIGQNRSVTIYRLMTSGTIEEKIYQRQIFKQFLANRILVDPRQKRFFKANDLQELFTLGDERVDATHGTETAAIFSEQPTEINRKNFFDERAKRNKKQKNKRNKPGKKTASTSREDEEDEEAIGSDLDDIEITLTDDYKAELREMARRYAQQMTASIKSAAPSIDTPATSETTTPKVEPEDVLLSAALSTSAQFVLPVESAVTVDESNNVKPRGDKKAKSSSSGKKTKLDKKKRLLDGKFEIRFLRKQRVYRDPLADGGEERGVDAASRGSSSSRDQDDYVLGHLLKSAGVNSALYHDRIAGDGSSIGDQGIDIDLIEEEACVTARRAAEVLKQAPRAHAAFIERACASNRAPLFGRRKATLVEHHHAPVASNSRARRRRVNDSDDDDVTSTVDDSKMFNGPMRKKVGPSTACITGSSNANAALSSNDLADIIKRRRLNQLEDITEEAPPPSDDEEHLFPSLAVKTKKLNVALGDKFEKLAEQVQQHFIKKDGKSTTKDILEKFQSKVVPADSYVFRQILRRLCVQLPNGFWSLRDEYR